MGKPFTKYQKLRLACGVARIDATVSKSILFNPFLALKRKINTLPFCLRGSNLLQERQSGHIYSLYFRSAHYCGTPSTPRYRCQCDFTDSYHDSWRDATIWLTLEESVPNS
ncbi:hypothetical protein AVEN_89863-1 [Araneus ventricosus]|uniref:Uncharacterized protein n=1 Tax=Araneus ventricosus TaxID=182803 RepID=A0A4Y2R064_ARAVE|nr:hypothetical protein AVEN_89863-1 [Araneus ventricosus]